MPQLGETVTEGTIARWLKKPGDSVEKYEAFVEVSTDKVNAEVPSPVTGTIRELIAAEGETVPTGAPIATIDEVGAAASPSAAFVAPALETLPLPLAAAPANGASNGASANGLSANGNGAVHANGTRVSPAVRRLAREHAVDVSVVSGTGTNGRVTAADVVAAAAGTSATAAAGSTTAVASAPVVTPSAVEGQPRPAPTKAPIALGELLPLTPARKLIARRMVESKHNAPHAWTMVEVDVTALWKWRLAERDAFEREHGVKLTLLPFFMHAVVESLRVFPLMNASFYDNGIAVHKNIHLGIATAADDGLVVPVVRNAEEKSIRGIAIAAGALIDKARRGKLGADDLAGGTFTVNNNGAAGSVLSAPIIVPGQAGIVTMEAVVKRPVVIDDAIAIRSMMNVCLSLDHRVVDGVIASGFLADLKKRLEAMGPTGSL
jgi:2-oxoisovalerate dehydrogenase E2 component (dihydrolipoyl transacylase)